LFIHLTNWIQRKRGLIGQAVCLVFSWLILFWAVFSWYDWFGLEEASGAFSAKIIDRVMAPFYQSEAQKDIVVILVNDDTLDAFQTAWPPQYSFHAELMRRILAQEPRGVFVDLLFERVRTYDHSLAAAKSEIQELARESHIPVYFAQSGSNAHFLFEDPSTPEIRGAVVRWSNVGDNYPLTLTSSAAGGSPLRKVSMTPAYSLFRVACLDTHSPLRGCTGPWQRDPPSSPASLSMRWGWFAQTRLGSKDLDLPKVCLDDVADLEKPWLRSLNLLWASLLPSTTSEIREAQRRKCPFTTTIFAHELADIFDAKGEPLLKNKIILLGANVPGIPDYVDTPVNGKLPGVYLHAMALDNLMHFGNSYPSTEGREKLELFGTHWFLSDLILILTALATSLFIVFTKARLKELQEHDDGVPKMHIGKLIVPFAPIIQRFLLFVILSMVAIVMYLNGQGTMNIVAYWAVMALPGEHGWLCQLKSITCKVIVHFYRHLLGKAAPGWCDKLKEKK
jgi:hypothetical protein